MRMMMMMEEEEQQQEQAEWRDRVLLNLDAFGLRSAHINADRKSC